MEALGIAERIGGALNDYFGIIHSQQFTLSSRKLLQLCHINHFEISHLDERFTKLGLTAEKPEPSPLVLLDKDDSELNSKQRRKKKHFARETEKRLDRIQQELGILRFEFQTENISAELENCIKFKRRQYQVTHSIDPLRHSVERRMLGKLSTLKVDSCSGILSTLYAGDQWLATHFGLINSHTMHYWFPVYNPQFQEYSPGRILILKMIEHARDHSIKVFDFGAGSSQMKRKFSNEENIVLKDIWKNSSVPALGYQTILSTGWKIKRGLSRLTELKASS